MNLREEISDITTKLEEMNYDGKQSVELLLELFKKYALEMVGKPIRHSNHEEKDEWYACVKCMEDLNKKEIRQRIEESTK